MPSSDGYLFAVCKRNVHEPDAPGIDHTNRILQLGIQNHFFLCRLASDDLLSNCIVFRI
jgi:hypothetical protein